MNAENENSDILTTLTVLKFLFFDAEATRKVAASRQAFWLGLLLVLVAGFAREYDGEYLVAEPWHLILPLAASWIGCTAMVLLIFVFLFIQSEHKVSFVEIFCSFLNVYWMTAPLALVYGIPVERMFDPAGATRSNLLLLALVAFWRVLLMIRCTQVLCGTTIKRAIFPVMLFSDVLAMLALWLVPGPIFMIMGGVRLTESEQIVLGVRMWLGVIGYGTLIIWLSGWLVICWNKSRVEYYRFDSRWSSASPVVSPALWAIAFAAIAVWFFWLPKTQAEQALRYQAEQMIESRNFALLRQLSTENEASQFPPHWDPPPRVGYGETEPDPLDVVEALLDGETKSWLIDVYAKKLAVALERDRTQLSDTSIPTSYFERLRLVIEKLPNGANIAQNFVWHQWVESGDLSAERIAIYDRLKEFADTADETTQ